MRPNQLTGYGIVVGLAGTGDDSLEYTTQGMKGVASRFGLTLPAGVNPALKNAAAVMITAELPAFAKPGQRLDITVSALGKAKSLRGGTLMMAPAARRRQPDLRDGAGQSRRRRPRRRRRRTASKVSVNMPSAGRIPGGATVERAVDTGFATTPQLIFNLAEADFTTAQRVAQAINGELGNVARATDGVSDRDRRGAGRREPHRDDEPDRESRGRSRRRAGPGDRQRPHRHGGDQRRGADRSGRGQPTAGSPSR